MTTPKLTAEQLASLTKLASLLPAMKLTVSKSGLTDEQKAEKIAKIEAEQKRIELIITNNNLQDS